MPAYSTRAKLDLMFGAHSITRWADLNSRVEDPDDVSVEAQAEIDAVVNDALDRMTSEINSRLRRSKYAIPFTSPPSEIVDICTMLTGAELYRPHRITDDKEQANQTVEHEKKANKMLQMISMDLLHLDAAVRVSTGPAVVDLSS